MNKPVLQTEVVSERQGNRKIVLFMFLALVAWLFVTVAQGVIFCGTFLGMRGK